MGLRKFAESINLIEKEPNPDPAPGLVPDAPEAPKVPPTGSLTQAYSAPAPAPVRVEPRSYGRADSQQKAKYAAALDAALQAADTPGGPDFLEFLNGLRQLASASIPEDAKFSTAVTMFNAQGVTPQKLISTSDHYLQALETEEKDFQGYIEDQRNSRVVNAQKQAEAAAIQIAQNEEKIQALVDENLKLNGQAVEFKQGAAIAESEISGNVKAFSEAKDEVISEIQGILNRLTAIVNIPK